ncbi:MAG TPA: nuclease-related domain-containing protein [Actinomycetota bacterium]|nr:nuclease-related domain-containing protein [Actinomycetota bacterium]
MTSAGKSAQREFERRAELDRARKQSRIRLKIAVVVLAAVVTYLAGIFLSSALAGVPARTGPLILAGLVLLTLLADWLAPRKSTTVWRTGAEGERRTARDLERLPPTYEVLHDLRIPGTKANIDHLVIGPSGVFTVETKRRSRDLQVRSKAARDFARQAQRQASVISEIVGMEVTPLVCLRGASMRGFRPFKPTVDGVMICSPTGLLAAIRRANAHLSGQEVARLIDLAKAGVRPS